MKEMKHSYLHNSITSNIGRLGEINNQFGNNRRKVVVDAQITDNKSYNMNMTNFLDELMCEEGLKEALGQMTQHERDLVFLATLFAENHCEETELSQAS